MKKVLAIVTIIFLVLFISACNVHAQYAKKNTVELGGSISYSSTTQVSDGNTASDANTLFQFQPYASYFLYDNFSVALSPGITILSPAGATESIKGYALFLVPGYTFNMKSNLFPYFQAMIGYTALKQGGTDLSGISFGAKGGAKLIVGNSGAVSFGISYILFNLSPSGASNRNGFNNLAFSMGYSIFFNK
ncbi:MAG: hypothetical protein WB996_10045 [Ignavibacteriaceae bacterium]